MMLLIFSALIMYLGVRLFLRSIGKSKVKYSNENARTYKTIGIVFFALGVALLVFYCLLNVFLP